MARFKRNTPCMTIYGLQKLFLILGSKTAVEFHGTVIEAVGQEHYHDLVMTWGGKLVFVRFNPDGKGPVIEERLHRLHAEITWHIGWLDRGNNTSYLEVHHLYYPQDTPDFYEEERSTLFPTHQPCATV
jgi:hypothetical protein